MPCTSCHNRHDAGTQPRAVAKNSDAMSTRMTEERQKLLNEYAATSRAFADAVERLARQHAGGEAFIGNLAEAGAAHRACERSRIRLDRHLSQRSAAPVA